MVANDVCLLAVESENEAISLTTANGFVQVPTWSPQFAGTAATNPGSRLALFWKRTVGGDAAPVVADSGNHTTGQIHCFSGVTTIGNPWDTGAGGNDGGANDTTGTIPGSTTTVNDTLVVLITSTSFNGTSTAQCSGWTNADLTSLTERTDNTNTINLGGGHCLATGAKASAGSYTTTTVTLAQTTYKGAISLALKPTGTVLGNGTDPGNATIGPGGAATMADAFTFQTGTGTDVITAVVVGLSAGSSGGLSLVEITNDAGTTVYGSVADPASDTPSITLSTNTLTATTTSTQYKIRITPKSHANMPAPPGSTYSVTAKINSWTGSGTQEGSDTAGTTVTIDNQSPADVTGASGTAGDAQVVFNWTNPGGETVAYSIVVLRSTATVADTPVEGATYAVGNTIGASVVRCVVSGLPPATTCTDSGAGGPANGTTYYYKIFTRDSNGNYSAAGVPLGPFTPAANLYAIASGNWNATTTWSSTSCGGVAGVTVPTTATNVIICATRTVTLTALGFCNNLTFDAAGAGSTLQHNAGIPLLVGGNVTINGSTTADGTKLWNIGAGSASVTGNVTLNGGSTNARIAQVNIATGGTLNISGGLTYNAAGAARAVINMSTGTGVLNLAGALTVNNGTLTAGTLGSTFNYNGTAAQTVRIGVSSIVYNNLHANNTSAAGATLDAAISAVNVTGNVRVQSGILNNGGFAIVGSAGDTFEVANGARFNLTGTSAMASGFGTRTFGATSTVNFQGGAQTVASGLTYGHLILDGGSTKTMAAGTTTIAGDFTLGTGTTRAATNNPTVNLAGNFSNSGTFNAGTGIFTFNGTAAQAITGATTFGNVVFNNAAGVTANSDLAIVRNFTNTAGFNAGSTTTTFNGTIDQTITGATTFNNLTLNNTSGSTTELTLNNDVTVNDTLSFLLGNIITGANTLIIGNTSGCGVTGAGTGIGYVVGNLRKNFTASLVNCSFEIGDAIYYTPVNNLTFASVTGPGYVTASSTNADHPNLADSGINGAASVNHYWTLTAGGGLTFTTCAATFYYDSADLDGGLVPDDFIIRRYATGAWSAVPVSGTPTLSETSGTPITVFGDFAIGMPGFIYTRESDFIYTRELYY